MAETGLEFQSPCFCLNTLTTTPNLAHFFVWFCKNRPFFFLPCKLIQKLWLVNEIKRFKKAGFFSWLRFTFDQMNVVLGQDKHLIQIQFKEIQLLWLHPAWLFSDPSMLKLTIWRPIFHITFIIILFSLLTGTVWNWVFIIGFFRNTFSHYLLLYGDIRTVVLNRSSLFKKSIYVFDYAQHKFCIKWRRPTFLVTLH